MHFAMKKPARQEVELAPESQSFQLNILNENSALQHFALFQTIPIDTGLPEPPVSLIWMMGTVAPGTPSNPSQGTFIWDDQMSAVTGYIHNLGTVTNPRQVIVFSNVDVEPNQDNTLTVTYLGKFPNGAPAFPAHPTDGAPATITLNTDTTIPTPNQTASENMTINAGVGMSASPTVVAQVGPNRTYPFSTIPTYHIVAGAAAVGQVVDTTLASRSFPVIFPAAVNTLTLAYSEQNQFKTV